MRATSTAPFIIFLGNNYFHNHKAEGRGAERERQRERERNWKVSIAFSGEDF